MELNGSHPVASAAARLCRFEHGHSPSWEDVACLECWGTALIADKDAAAEAELSEECPADPYLVDEVAVARAVVGESVELTVAEWQAAKLAVARSRGVCLRHARGLLSGHVTVVDALGNPLTPPILGVASRGVASAARIVNLASRARSRRKAARRASFVSSAAELAA